MDKMIKGTETEKSLLKAFAGESQAKNRYTFFSEIAKKEGYEQIAGIFYETALQEEMHAKRFFSYLEGGMIIRASAKGQTNGLAASMEKRRLISSANTKNP